MKNPKVVKSPTSKKGFVTKDKEYKVIRMTSDNLFNIELDNGYIGHCRLVCCAYLDGEDWIVVE